MYVATLLMMDWYRSTQLYTVSSRVPLMFSGIMMTSDIGSYWTMFQYCSLFCMDRPPTTTEFISKYSNSALKVLASPSELHLCSRRQSKTVSRFLSVVISVSRHNFSIIYCTQ